MNVTLTGAAFIAAFIFFFGQNFCFGWNATAQSHAESIADGITAWLFIVAVVISILEPRHQPKPTTTIIITHGQTVSAPDQGERDGSSI